MTATPPPGWYPDPEAAGRRWRWWDGARWAPAGYGYALPGDPRPYAVVVDQQAQTTRNTGRWLQWAMAANAVAFVVLLAMAAAGMRDFRHALFDPNGDASGFGTFSAWRVLALPFQFVPTVFLVMLVAWVYHAGKFAEIQRWPSVRGRTLGAFSLIIPIVNLWWPYEAIRDSYPPGTHPRLLLHWWLAHVVLAPIVGLAVAIAALAGATGVSVVFVVIGAVVAPIPAVLGWRLVDDLTAVQRAQLPG